MPLKYQKENPSLELRKIGIRVDPYHGASKVGIRVDPYHGASKVGIPVNPQHIIYI